MNGPSTVVQAALFVWGVYSTAAPVPPVDQRIIQDVRRGTQRPDTNPPPDTDERPRSPR